MSAIRLVRELHRNDIYIHIYIYIILFNDIMHHKSTCEGYPGMAGLDVSCMYIHAGPTLLHLVDRGQCWQCHPSWISWSFRKKGGVEGSGELVKTDVFRNDVFQWLFSGWKLQWKKHEKALIYQGYRFVPYTFSETIRHRRYLQI